MSNSVLLTVTVLGRWKIPCSSEYHRCENITVAKHLVKKAFSPSDHANCVSYAFVVHSWYLESGICVLTKSFVYIDLHGP